MEAGAGTARDHLKEGGCGSVAPRAGPAPQMCPHLLLPPAPCPLTPPHPPGVHSGPHSLSWPSVLFSSIPAPSRELGCSGSPRPVPHLGDLGEGKPRKQIHGASTTQQAQLRDSPGHSTRPYTCARGRPHILGPSGMRAGLPELRCWLWSHSGKSGD